MLNVKEEFKKVVYGLLYIFIFISAVRYFKLTIIQIYFVLTTINLIAITYKKQSVKLWFKNCFQIAAVLGLMQLLKPYGFTGYILSVIILSGLILYRRRKHFLKIKWHIESMLFGKPIKEFVKEGKKPPKIEVTF